MPFQKIIVTADDFGLSPEINQAIHMLCQKKVISKVSILSNFIGFEEAGKELLGDAPETQWAIHLNLTDGAPVSSQKNIPTLVNKDKVFYGGKHYLVAALLTSGKMKVSEVVQEWEMQTEKAISAGFSICELNSHGHLHLHPKLHGSVIQILKKFNIPRVRLISSAASLKGRIYTALSSMLQSRLREANIQPVESYGTIGIGSEGKLRTQQIICEANAYKHHTAELIVHPAYPGCTYHRAWDWIDDLDFKTLQEESFINFLSTRRSHD